MLELKEKEMKKASKEAKKKTKQDKDFNRLVETAAKIDSWAHKNIQNKVVY